MADRAEGPPATVNATTVTAVLDLAGQLRATGIQFDRLRVIAPPGAFPGAAQLYGIPIIRAQVPGLLLAVIP